MQNTLNLSNANCEAHISLPHPIQYCFIKLFYYSYKLRRGINEKHIIATIIIR